MGMSEGEGWWREAWPLPRTLRAQKSLTPAWAPRGGEEEAEECGVVADHPSQTCSPKACSEAPVTLNSEALGCTLHL